MSATATASIRLLLCLLLAAAAHGRACADEVERPRFVAGPVHSPNAALVERVESSLAADFVVLDGGLEAGLRVGVVCRVERGVEDVGEILIVESRGDRAAALILSLEDGRAIRTGDVARLKARAA